jgi:hypothetical protein
MGCQAVVGTTNTPYIIDMKETRLKEIEVAIGAPMKPRQIGFGPHTEKADEKGARQQGEQKNQGSS